MQRDQTNHNKHASFSTNQEQNQRLGFVRFPVLGTGCMFFFEF